MTTLTGDKPGSSNIDDGESISVASTSYYSTNYTEPNLPGAGRVLGLAYDSAGRQLEKAMGVVAQKVGYRLKPYATYQEISQELSHAGWMDDEKKSMCPLYLHSQDKNDSLS